MIRQYSLWDWDPQGNGLSVAAKREEQGRGGSLAIHALSEGAEIGIGGPRNHFALQSQDTHITLIGGGIGATPIVALARHLARHGADLRVIYLTRSRANAAMHETFAALDPGAG